jgi:very-short-patch-repair endonuclease
MGESITDIAERQHGVIAVSQLQAVGLDANAIDTRVGTGLLHRVHQGVYAVGHRLLTMRARYLAAVLACGPEAGSSHRSGGDLHSLRRNSYHLEVTAPRTCRGHRGITVHRSRMMEPVDFTEVDGIRVTTVARTLLDLAGILSPRDLGYTLDRAERLQAFDLTAIEDVLSRAKGRKGAKALRDAIADWRPTDTRSELERRLHDLVRSTSLAHPRFNVVLEGERYEHTVDAYWPAARLVVQLDGFDYHRTRRDRERDATTDADLELMGYRVMRLTWDDVSVHRHRTVRRLRHLLTTRGAATRASGPRA